MSFQYKKRELYAEGIPVRQIAKEYGTPLYIYSRDTIVRNYRAYEQAFRKIPHLICFAVKSNSSNAILRVLAMEGAGADIVSGGELYRALRANIPPQRVVFAGVGKTEAEIEYALNSEILLFNVESPEELRLINALAARLKVKASVGLRVNPDVDAHTHPHIATGRNEDKFGMPVESALSAFREAQEMRNIRVRGLHMHLGSQISSTRPYETALKRASKILGQLHAWKIPLDFMDIGGGAAIAYQENEVKLNPSDLARSITRIWSHDGCTFILEPGRSIVGEAGVLITKILYRKSHFVIVDAGMNDLIRPALYDAHHEIIPVKRSGRRTAVVSIAGPVCESADFLGKRRRMENPLSGDLLAILNCGGYGSSMSSQYNSRPRAAEVLVDGKMAHLIRKRETYEDLIRNENVQSADKI